MNHIYVLVNGFAGSKGILQGCKKMISHVYPLRAFLVLDACTLAARVVYTKNLRIKKLKGKRIIKTKLKKETYCLRESSEIVDFYIIYIMLTLLAEKRKF